MGLTGDDEEGNDPFYTHQGDEEAILAACRVYQEGELPREGIGKSREQHMGGETVVHWKARAEVLEQQTIWLQKVLQNALEGRTLQSSKILNGVGIGDATSTQRIEDLEPYIQQLLLK